MPWSSGDATRFKKGLSEKQSRKWAHVANSTLLRTGSEAAAIRAANGVTRGSVQRRLKRDLQAKRGV